MSELPRRRLLAVTGTALTGAVAGCTGSDEDAGTVTGTVTGAETGTGTRRETNPADRAARSSGKSPSRI